MGIKISFTSEKFSLVLLALLVKGKLTMKRIYSLVVLMGLVMGALLTGCSKDESMPAAPNTNAAPAAPTPPPAPAPPEKK
ncbi:MAG: hypothetical protein DME25_21455, partial [Verrucomicrobia bacterium]